MRRTTVVLLLACVCAPLAAATQEPSWIESDCAILDVTVGEANCDPQTNTYSQVLVVEYLSPPPTGVLNVAAVSLVQLVISRRKLGRRTAAVDTGQAGAAPA